MKASVFEFRFRFLIHGIIYLIGFLAPWNMVHHFDTVRTWQLLAAEGLDRACGLISTGWQHACAHAQEAAGGTDRQEDAHVHHQQDRPLDMHRHVDVARHHYFQAAGGTV